MLGRRLFYLFFSFGELQIVGAQIAGSPGSTREFGVRGHNWPTIRYGIASCDFLIGPKKKRWFALFEFHVIVELSGTDARHVLIQLKIRDNFSLDSTVLLFPRSN